uniref:Putative peritrophin-like protein n=1 Tax=Lutzomyia longipalpis TaxID=7200 RepID=A0A1B0GHK8_LUTLO
MKSCVALGVLALICGSQAASSALFPSILTGRATITPAADDPKAVCGADYGNKCLDCYNMLTCLGPNLEPAQTACPADRKYCDRTNKVCVAEQPPEADCLEPPKSKFACSSPNGFFPHPTNCSQYFECYNGEAINLECPPGYVWTTNGMGCKQRKVTADCGTITCKTGVIQVPLSNNATYYGICNQPSSLEGIVVVKCKGRLTFTGESCNFVCTTEGMFVDDENPAFYYECYKSGTKTLWKH